MPGLQVSVVQGLCSLLCLMYVPVVAFWVPGTRRVSVAGGIEVGVCFGQTHLIARVFLMDGVNDWGRHIKRVFEVIVY